MKLWKSDAGQWILPQACFHTWKELGSAHFPVNWPYVGGAWVSRLLFHMGQTASTLGSAGSVARPQLYCWNSKAARHYINSNETYLWTQNLNFQHKHTEKYRTHSWPSKHTELSAEDPGDTVKFLTVLESHLILLQLLWGRGKNTSILQMSKWVLTGSEIPKITLAHRIRGRVLMLLLFQLPKTITALEKLVQSVHLPLETEGGSGLGAQSFKEEV